MRKTVLWDLHFQMKDKERHEEIIKALGDGGRDFFVERGYDPEDPELLGKLLAQDHQRKMDYYNTFDLSILDEFDLTLEDFLKQQEMAGNSSRGGKVGLLEKHLDVFLKTVISCESKGTDYAGTINALREKINEITEVSLRNWLNMLIESPKCDIPRPRLKT